MTTHPSRRPLLAALAALTILAAGCGGGRGTHGLRDIRRLPHTTTGALLLAPPRDATGVDPSQPVIVQTRYSDVFLQKVSVTREGGEAFAGTLTSGRFVAEGVLKPDATYTVTAVATLPAAAGGSSPSSEQTETLTFSTQTTPRVLSVSPTVVAPGKSAVVTLDTPARDVKVAGEVSSRLESGARVTLSPRSYRPGQTFSVSLTATNLKGTAGEAQTVRFMAAGGPTASVSLGQGASNIGVGAPLTVTLSQPPANPADFAGHFEVTADVTSPVAAPPAPPVTFGASGTFQPDPCPQYAPPPAGAPLVVAPTWVSPTRLQLTPKTPDGYWPPNTAVTLTGRIDGLPSQDGSWFSGAVHRAFLTGDKRVIDVDLSSQTLTACRNGVRANQFPVSTGIRGKETPAGSFAIYERHTDTEMKSSESPFAPGYYDVKHVPWTQYFHAGDALHGAWWHNNFGRPMSHGCVNISTQTRNSSWPEAAPNAEYLWHFDNLGDPVIVHGSTP